MISFWSTFDIDVTSFVTILDVPKSFFLPLTEAYYPALIIMFFVFFRATESWNNATRESEHIGKMPASDASQLPITRSWIRRLIDFILPNPNQMRWLKALVGPLTFTAFFYGFFFYADKPAYWSLLGGLIPGYLVGSFISSSFLTTQIPNLSLRIIIGIVICATPLLSFSIGKTDALYIFNNSKITMIKRTGIERLDKMCEADSIKLVGFIGDVMVVSSLDNKLKTIVRHSNLDAVELANRVNK